MERRTFLSTVGSIATVAVAGCSSNGGTETQTSTSTDSTTGTPGDGSTTESPSGTTTSDSLSNIEVNTETSDKASQYVDKVEVADLTLMDQNDKTYLVAPVTIATNGSVPSDSCVALYIQATTYDASGSKLGSYGKQYKQYAAHDSKKTLFGFNEHRKDIARIDLTVKYSEDGSNSC